MRKEKGFSLIELVIVIGIIGIMSAVSIYSWRGFRDNNNLRTAARDIATDISATRQRAVAAGRIFRITFRTSTNDYIIEQGALNSPTGTPFTTIETKSPTIFGAGSALSINSANFSGAQQVLFYTRGTLSSGTVVLRNRKGSTATLTVNFAGRTHVQFAMQ